MLRFGTTKMERKRQQKLYDVGTIVASVGGSLGLFLGFSCLGAGRATIDRIFVP